MSNQWSEFVRDAILDDSALRNGLTDDEAQPLIDWGLDVLAAKVGERMERLPEVEAEEAFDIQKTAVLKLMTRITWTVIYREKKGADWTLNTLNQLNEYNQHIYGMDAPQISEEQQQVIAQQQDGMANGELVLELMRQLSPTPVEEASSEATPVESESLVMDDPALNTEDYDL